MVPDLVALGTLGEFVKGRGLAKADLTDEGVPCLRYAEIYTKYGDVTRSLISRTSQSGARASRPFGFGDIAFAASGETAEEIGKAVAYIGSDPAVVGGDTVVLTKHGQDPTFLAHAVNFEDVAKQKAALGKGHSVVHIHAPDLAKLMLWLPPLPEQRRIAAVLDAWDTAIATAERLVEAKRNSLRGLIDRLIDRSAHPRTELCDFARLVSDKIMVDDAPYDGSIELDNLESDSGRRLGITAVDGLQGQRAHFHADDVLFGKLRPYLRKFWFADEDGMASTETWILRADTTKCLPRYLYFLVRSHAFLGEANRPTGSRMPRADWDWVQSTPLPLPGTNEQGRIVDLLTAAEDSCRVSLDHVSALRTQKRGLMQQLLTGKIRVPESIDSLMPGGGGADV
jgi:type I restriction enzyme, S subunit